MKHFCHKICLVVLACFSYLSASAYDFEADGLYFTITSLKDLTVSVDGAVNKDTYKIVIPQTVAYKNKSLTVTSVGDNAFKGYKNLQSVSFPKTVLSIGNSAFEKDSLLTGVVLPDSLLRIESNAFYSCQSLDKFTISSSVTDISPSIIWECPNITKLTIGKGLNGLPFCKRVYNVYKSYWLRPEQCFATETLTNEYTPLKNTTQDKSFLTKLKTVIIEDTNEDFSIRGYYIGEKKSGQLLYDAYLPSFSNFDLDYYYVGRPLTDIRSWVVDDKKYRIEHVEKIGHIKKLEIAGMCTENPYFYQDVDTLVLGSNIMSFVVENLYYDSLKTIVCKSTIPPSGMSSSCYPAKIYTDVTLYVPKGCKEAYSNDSGWGTFWDIREFEDDSSTAAVANVIDNQRNITITTQKGSIIVNNAPRNTLVQVYNLQGTLIAKSHEGVINGLSKGAYLITIGAKTFKIVL